MSSKRNVVKAVAAAGLTVALTTGIALASIGTGTVTASSLRLRSEAKENGERVRELERELAETRQAKRNAERATGSAASAGGDVERDMAAIGWNEV